MRRVVIAGCLLLALTACRSQEPIEPTPTPKPTATSSSAADPDINPPTLPAQARKNTPEGAAAFVAYWVKTFNYAARTGDTKLMRSVSAASCGGCQKYADLFQSTYEDGGYFRGSDWTVRRVSVEPGDVETLIRARVTAPAGTFKESESSPVRKGTIENSRLAFAARFDGRWTLTQLVLGSKVS